MRIAIPEEFVQCCAEWHRGSASMMYAISSTGALSLGTNRPLGCGTDEKWMWHLLNELESEIYSSLRITKKVLRPLPREHQRLTEFSAFVSKELEKFPEPEDE